MPLLGSSKSLPSEHQQSSTAEEVQQPPASGKTDLLLRFFDSQFFDEWIALTYLYKSTSPGVQDYLCNRLYNLPEKGLERYLSQLCQLIINRPHSSLERVMIDLCARSLRIAVKVYWLLLAISQDQPKNTYVAELRDQCERAALEGYWEPPFRDPKLLPLSPPRARWLVGSPRSPAASGSSFKLRQSLSSRFGSPEPFLSPPRSRPSDLERPTSPDGLGGEIYSSYSMGQGLEGLICASPSAVRSAVRGDPRRTQSSGDSKSRSNVEQSRRLAVNVGDRDQSTALLEGAATSGLNSPRPRSQATTSQPERDLVDLGKELSPPSSPRLRQTTFGATLDFIEALCDASSGLTSFQPEDRQWALRKGLEEINKEIELASCSGVACWFPMGSRNERIVRLAGKEAVLLNSREKAPFMLIVEVIGEAAEEEGTSPPSKAGQATENGSIGEEAGPCADRVESHATAGPGPGSRSRESPLAGRGSRQPGAQHAQQSGSPERRSRLSPTPVAGSKPSPGQGSTLSWRGGLSASFRSKDSETSTKPKAMQSADDSFSKGLKTAMEGLQGSGPLVSVTLEVVNEGRRDFLPTTSEPSTSSTTSSYTGSPGSHDMHGHAKPMRAASKVGVIHEDDDVAFNSSSKGIGLLCTWAVCRAKGEPFDRHWRPNEVYVKVRLKMVRSEESSSRVRMKKSRIRFVGCMESTFWVHGGVDLRLNAKPHGSHRRVPSDEAILRMAAQQRVRPPGPRDLLNASSAPLPDVSSTSTQADGSGAADSEAQQQQLMRRDSQAAKRQAEAAAVFGERYAQKWGRIKAGSPHGRRPGWAARPVIVKSGDDCRQELLAAQLIDAFCEIFQEAQLPLYLRPYEVLVTSNRTALIEMVPDTLSLHQLKAKSPTGSSLAEFFFAKFVKGTPACEQAQRNFAESTAAYSIVCYLLQIKDRHNGNILMDDEGHLIHIDFGFMLSNSPGGVNFEAAPFKLTRELLEVLDSNAEGRASEMFDYFKVLCIQGFLACRKHADRIILLVEMMQNSGCPCFKAGARAVSALRKRFHLTLPESQCVEVVLGLISDSVDAWRTRQYDQYQRVMNGIL